MKNNKGYTPTPQELRKTVGSMSQAQKLQFEAIINMVTALLVSVHYAQITEINKKEN